MSSVIEVQTADAGRGLRIPSVWTGEALEAGWNAPRVSRPGSRRAANVVAALLMLLLTAPLMLVIALLVRLTSAGPVIYVQTRVGIDRRRGTPSASAFERRRVDYGGRLFRIYKFRTMVQERGATVERWAQHGDPRITAVGRVLRKYRLDELPQLFNVLIGDMNLVGPRPEQPRLFAELRDQIEGYGQRQAVLPGITGWAQVNGGYDGCVDDVRSKLRFDLEYVESASVLGDLRILARTIPVVLFQRGAI